jgi:Na+-transporting NADH:ubiquinone oxidoreductase subunit NqrB
MPVKSFVADARYFQVIFQLIFLSYGIIYLQWNVNWLHYAICIGGCVLFNLIFEAFRLNTFVSLLPKFTHWGLSALISALGLCLLLKTNHWYVSLLATFFTISSKYIFRYSNKHFFNPSAFGIIATIVLTKDAWISPGQWGNNIILLFFIATLGTIVVTSVQKLDVSLAFLITYILLLWWRQIYVLHWPIDYFIHSITTGSLLLFTFFMISDPKTAPNHPVARIVWAVLIAIVSFYLTTFQWKYNTVIWILVAAAPFVFLLDKLFKAESFNWKSNLKISHQHYL